MGNEVWLLAGTAVAVGTIHTLAGPDHYVPFIAMARARNWQLPRTLLITFLCGLGHVFGSVILGLVGIVWGFSLLGLETTEGHRGDLAAWCLIAFGLAYTIWGIRKALRSSTHVHPHAHGDGEQHEHLHDHHATHAHPHVAAEGSRQRRNVTPWILFTIFVFGPCEPLIPILMFPAAQQSWSVLALVTAAFAVCTIGVMLAVVAFATYGLSFMRMRFMERYSHALAGLAILACGCAIHLGL